MYLIYDIILQIHMASLNDALTLHLFAHYKMHKQSKIGMFLKQNPAAASQLSLIDPPEY